MPWGRATAQFQGTWALPLCGGTIQWWRVLLSLPSVVATTWSLAAELSNLHKHCNHKLLKSCFFLKLGPHPTLLFWHLKSEGLHMHTYSSCGCKRHPRQNKWDHSSGEDYKSYRLEWSNLTDSWHMHKAHQALEKRSAVLLSDFLKMKEESLGKCNLWQYCNSESCFITLPRGGSFMSWSNVRPYCSVWVSQMNKMRTLSGKLTNQGEEYFKKSVCH